MVYISYTFIIDNVLSINCHKIFIFKIYRIKKKKNYK